MWPSAVPQQAPASTSSQTRQDKSQQQPAGTPAAAGSRAARQSGDDIKLPSTVEDMVKGWFAAAPPLQAAKPVAAVSGDDAGAPSMPPKRLPGAQAPKSARNAAAPARRVASASSSSETYAPDEVIGVNLSAAGAARAREMGFRVSEAVHLSVLRGSLTRLTSPVDVDAATARDLLRTVLPREHFALNQFYRFYQTAAKDRGDNAGDSASAEEVSEGTCQSDRCFGFRTIQWRDHLRSCASSLRIGVIDTGVDSAHPAFSKARLNVGSFLPEGKMPASNWHGTGVLALLAGDAGGGTPGLIPQADFYAANVFFIDEGGEAATDTASLLNALEWLNALDAKIVNMSFSGPKDELIEKAIGQMSANGIVFVAAAGNDGPTAAPAYPAAYKSVIAVTAITRELRNYPYANRGHQIDVAAPGVDIWTAVPDARQGYHSGTSFAAPYVTGVLAAAYRNTARARKEELLDRLSVVDLGPPGRDPIYGRGLLLAPDTCRRADGMLATADPQPAGFLTQSLPASSGSTQPAQAVSSQ